ncbi:hypothetical protein [Sphingobium baderi]|nr:hypothetical protein [Sphingobium baderi]KMS64019.1 hypothetical protein V475_23180 [Sphingobium baderi LL03]
MTPQFAKTLGSIAYANGLPCAPAASPEFMAAINPAIGSNIDAMKAWLSGWVEASLAA